MSFFYLNTDRPIVNRYDYSHVVEFRDGMYDDFTSYFLTELKKQPSAGFYTIAIARRPDVYSYDIYQTTRYWHILLEYNNIVLLNSLTAGLRLEYPPLAALENIYFSLNSLNQASS